MNNYQILEIDNVLYLAILSDPEFCDFFIPGVEDSADPVETLINGIESGEFMDYDFAAWTPYSAIPRSANKLYHRHIRQGAKVIADNNGVYPEMMGETGLRIFNIRKVA